MTSATISYTEIQPKLLAYYTYTYHEYHSREISGNGHNRSNYSKIYCNPSPEKDKVKYHNVSLKSMKVVFMEFIAVLPTAYSRSPYILPLSSTMLPIIICVI